MLENIENLGIIVDKTLIKLYKVIINKWIVSFQKFKLLQLIIVRNKHIYLKTKKNS